MNHRTFAAWSERLRSVAERTLGPASAPTISPTGPAAFADELGHRRRVDAPFLAWRAAAGGSDVPTAQPTAPGALTGPLDVLLWHAVLDGSVGVEPLVHAVNGSGPAPLIPPEEIGAIEVWTESELCALHALWRIGVRRRREEFLRRCLLAAAWHVEHVQPDNATNHPWAVHIFVVAAQRTGGAEYDLHAQSMLHNCQVALGRPDALSAHILVDAAECLDEAADHTP